MNIKTYKIRTGESIGFSDWQTIGRKSIIDFAELTGDKYFIHTDYELASRTKLGDQIAHGFLVLSLIPALAENVIPKIDGVQLVLNYGLDKIRFTSPVRANDRIRAEFYLNNITPRSDNMVKITHEVIVHIEGRQKPALVCSWVWLVEIAD